MEQNDLSRLVERHTRSLGIVLTDKQIKLFVLFLRQLQAWNKKANLTSITNDEEIVIKHFVDSLALLKAEEIQPGARILDVGTGAGFPGIPLKIARPDLSITLLEPIQKKASFLHFVVGLLTLESVNICCGNLQQFALESEKLDKFDYVVSRALKNDVVMNNAMAIMSQSGKCIFFLSKPVSESCIGSQWLIEREFSFELPRNSGSRIISVLAKRSSEVINVPRGT